MSRGHEDGPEFDHPTEKCGVVGVSLSDRAAALPTYYALYALQHRGQESAGIVTHDGFQQHQHVGMGLVGDAFDEDDVESLHGSAGIGHVRYPTAGSVDKSCAQPFSVSFKGGALGLSHNGNLVNADEIRADLAASGHAFTSDGDTEVIAHDLARNLLDSDLVRAVQTTMNRIHGSYSLTIMHDDTVMGVRDPLGNRPLVLGELDDGYILASESAAIDTVGGELVRDVKPGNWSSSTRTAPASTPTSSSTNRTPPTASSSTSTSRARTPSSTRSSSTRCAANSADSSGGRAASRATS